jgi:SAM-dependent methyltransferase
MPAKENGFFGEIAWRIKRARRWIKKKARTIGTRHCCPVCQNRIKQFDMARKGNAERVRCPFCHSKPRHRLIWLYLERRLKIGEGNAPGRLIHFAAESGICARLSRLIGAGYWTCDYTRKRRETAIQGDVTRLGLADGAFDALICSHVLEHVVEDLAAMRELCRVLRPGGWGIVAVPIIAEKTWHDPNATTRKERKRLYGLPDHVRAYGPDFADRLAEAGFEVKTERFAEELTAEEREYYGLQEELFFFVRRPGLGGEVEG